MRRRQYQPQRADRDNHATHAARSLPGELDGNLSALMRIRAQRVRKMRSLGLDNHEIFESLGLTYRQQLYALKWEARHAIQG
jgi:hypothetical protein